MYIKSWCNLQSIKEKGVIFYGLERESDGEIFKKFFLKVIQVIFVKNFCIQKIVKRKLILFIIY